MSFGQVIEGAKCWRLCGRTETVPTRSAVFHVSVVCCKRPGRLLVHSSTREKLSGAEQPLSQPAPARSGRAESMGVKLAKLERLLNVLAVLRQGVHHSQEVLEV